jgi:hypothetical protein
MPSKEYLSVSPIPLGDVIPWNARLPTSEECKRVGRDAVHAMESLDAVRYGWADHVIVTPDVPEAKEHLARAFELFDSSQIVAHIIPAGIYIEGPDITQEDEELAVMWQ